MVVDLLVEFSVSGELGAALDDGVTDSWYTVGVDIAAAVDEAVTGDFA